VDVILTNQLVSGYTAKAKHYPALSPPIRRGTPPASARLVFSPGPGHSACLFGYKYSVRALSVSAGLACVWSSEAPSGQRLPSVSF
jgi:hypothetical protein